MVVSLWSVWLSVCFIISVRSFFVGGGTARPRPVGSRRLACPSRRYFVMVNFQVFVVVVRELVIFRSLLFLCALSWSLLT